MNADTVLEAARATLTGSLPFPDIVDKLMQTGVQGYAAFLRGQRVTYFCRQGDQHTEWFSGAKPADS